MSVPTPVQRAPRGRTAPSSALRGRLRRARGWIASGVIVALIGTVAVISSGFDAQEIPREEPSVWVTRDAGQYARVNTETGEIDTVRKVSEPSGVLQAGAESVLLTNGNGRAWPVNAAMAVDLGDTVAAGTDDAEAAKVSAREADDTTTAGESAQSDGSAGHTDAVRLPEGTRDVLVAGDSLMLRTEAGAAYVGSLRESGEPETETASPEQLAARLESLRRIDPLAESDGLGGVDGKSQGDTTAASDDEGVAGENEPRELAVDAIALSPEGVAALYSGTDGTLWRFDLARDDFVGGETRLPSAAAGLAAPQLALVAGDWVLLDVETGTVWREGASATSLELAGAAKLQASGPGDGAGAGGGSDALIADTTGLWRVPVRGEAERIADARGTPTQPRAVGATQYAAWIGPNAGTLWDSEERDSRTLSFDEAVRDLGESAPVVYSNGARAVLGETRTGMLWTLPEGRPIPLSQWTIADPPKEDQGTVVVDEVTEQVPPTAVDDAFGVRQGEPAPLPVLLNDFDPNKRDILTIVPESLGESPLPEAFGVVELMPDAQSLSVRPKPGASGSATLSYRVSDGALTSEPATVTLTVVPQDTNTAPAWCPVEGCQRAWEVPAIAPGGTLVYPILEGWVDPEGDPMMLADVELLRPEDPASAIVTADGRLAVKHADANAGASEILLRLTVRDGHGSETHRDLQVAVDPGAAPEFQAMATAVKVGETTTLTPLDRAAGGSGAFELADVAVQSGDDRVGAIARTTDGRVEVTASDTGEALLTLGLRDTVTGAEFTGLIRVTATSATPALALPPLRAFVRPFSDSTVEVLDAIPGAGSRAVSVESAVVSDGALQADVIEHARVRVAGSTEDGGAGRVGAVDITVSEGRAGAQGRLTVFQVPEAGAHGAIAVADSATVRAGSVVDIRVLDNDVAAPGERLVLHPEITSSGASGELAFASGSTLRYLAPKKPGTYRLSYTTYGASNPEASDVGTVTVTVTAKGANQDPHPAALTVRVAPGERGSVDVPLSGVDPDGDRVRLVGVGAVKDPQLTTSLASSATAIEVEASGQAETGTTTVTYSVSDGQGGAGTGKLRIIVTPGADNAGAPIASSDYVRLVRGSPEAVAVRPLENDVDPAQGTLKIISVLPNMPGGESHPDFQRAKKRLDLSKMNEGVVAVTPGEELGTVSYRYTVQSSASSSTAEGLLLAHTSERVGVQAPRVSDTVLNVRERSELNTSGVDVVTDKVRWAAGDASKLKLSLWKGNESGYRVSGNTILGEYKPEGDLVAFELSGLDAAGTKVSSYGFLIIPPLDELRITLKPGLEPLNVDENKSVDATLRSFLDVASDDRVELAQQRFSVGRSQASCSAISPQQIRYTAGSDAPWSDSCLVNVRLVGQTTWTSLPVPISIVPRKPVVELQALTRTISPGDTQTIDLTDMVEWQGNRAGNASKLRFSVPGGASQFRIQQSGASLGIEARADATPGSQQTLTVSVSGAGESEAPLTLRVGAAPKQQPKGGSVNLSCTVGSKCAIDVVGVAGEYDPFAGKQGGGLKLETVNGASCSFGTVQRASARGVAVTWPDDRGPGGQCTVGFTVRDAQGRTGEGSIELDARGVPRAPASVTQQGFTGNSVDFLVELGAGQSAHPAVTGVEVSGAGTSSCTAAGPASYECTVRGLENGVKHEFTARAVNSVGRSDPSSAVTAWAYAVPKPPEITAVPVADSRATIENGVIELTLRGPNDASRYRVTVGESTHDVQASGRPEVTARVLAPVGPQQVSVTSLSQHQPPAGAPAEGTAASTRVLVAGAPTPGSVTLTSPARGQITATATGSGANHAPDGTTLTYAFTEPVREGQAVPACTSGMSYSGSAAQTFTGLSQYSVYQVRACVKTNFGVSPTAVVKGSPQSLGSEAIPAIQKGEHLRYTIAPNATVTGTRGDYGVLVGAQPKADEGLVLRYEVNGILSDTYRHDENSTEPIYVRQCMPKHLGGACSAPVALEPTGAPTIVRAQLASGNECVAEGDALGALEISSAARPFATATADSTGKVTVTWSGSFASLKPLVLQGRACSARSVDPPT